MLHVKLNLVGRSLKWWKQKRTLLESFHLPDLKKQKLFELLLHYELSETRSKDYLTINI